jgi:hypothetical protein
VKPRRGFGALAVLGIAAGLWLAHWTDRDQPRVYADSYQYLRLANEIRGDRQAGQSALRVYCAESGPKDSQRRQQCAADIGDIERSFGPRYQAVFRSRPGFPLILASTMTVFGPLGVPLASAVVFIGVAVLLYAAVRAFGRSRIEGLIAVTLFGVLPSGVFASMLLSEGTLMLGVVSALYGVALLLSQGDGKRRIQQAPGIALLIAGLATACLARGVVGATLAAALALGALTIDRAPTTRTTRRRIAGLCAASATLALAVPAALHQPGIAENLQLQATDRFTHPDVRDPWRHLLRADQKILTVFLRDLTGHGYSVALAVLGLTALVLVLRRAAWAWLAPAAVAVVAAAAYPEQAAAYRFLSPLWISVAVGLSVAAGRLRTGRPAQQDNVDDQTAATGATPPDPAELLTVHVRHRPDEAVGQPTGPG